MKQNVKWAFIFIVSLFGMYVAYDHGVHEMILRDDRSYLSWVILMLWFISSVILGKRQLWPSTFHENLDIQFVPEMLVKIGMIGTVIGFLLTFQSLNVSFNEIDFTDHEQLKELITTMATGMSTALWTTLVGLVTSLSMQLQILSTET